QSHELHRDRDHGSSGRQRQSNWRIRIRQRCRTRQGPLSGDEAAVLTNGRIEMDRRTFFLTSGGGMVYAGPATSITLGVIGAGGRGTLVMTTFQKSRGVRVGGVCDVYEPNLERGVSTAAKAQSSAPKAFRNYKLLLEDKSIDAVLIATPEHWHAQMVLDALAAGKDVYVEKPLCRTPEEGVALVEAEKRTRQIIQVGMQRRSYDLYLEGRRI